LRRLSLAQARVFLNVSTTFVKSTFFLKTQEPLKSLSFCNVNTQPTALTQSEQSTKLLQVSPTVEPTMDISNNAQIIVSR
jgi:hypothetical protein